MDAGILKAALSQQAHVPTSVTSDQYFNPRAAENDPHAHSSQLLSDNGGRGWTNESTFRRLYTWTDVMSDEIHRNSLKKLYNMHHQATNKCLFSWEVRSALGDYFCPPKSTSEDLFRIGRDNPGDQKAISRHIIDMVLTAVVDGETENADFLQTWAEDILKDENSDDLLNQMYIEMETKASRERTIWSRLQKNRSGQAPKSSITLYSNTPPPPTPAPAAAKQSHGQDPPITPHPQPVKKETHVREEPHQEFATLDDDVLRERRMYSRYLSLKEHVDETARDRVYNTLSMRMFSFALIASFWIGLIFNIWCVDGYAIIFTFFYCHGLGLAGLSLASVLPRYLGLDVFYVVGWLAVVIMFIYTFLRIAVYSYGGCRVEDFAEIAILLSWLFGVGVMLFASTILGLRKRVEDWQAQRSAVSVQKQILGKSQ